MTGPSVAGQRDYAFRFPRPTRISRTSTTARYVAPSAAAIVNTHPSASNVVNEASSAPPSRASSTIAANNPSTLAAKTVIDIAQCRSTARSRSRLRRYSATDASTCDASEARAALSGNLSSSSASARNRVRLRVLCPASHPALDARARNAKAHVTAFSHMPTHRIRPNRHLLENA